MILYNCFLNQLRKEKRKICLYAVFYNYIKLKKNYIYSSSSGEGNGNPLQDPCLENPMDGGEW